MHIAVVLMHVRRELSWHRHICTLPCGFVWSLSRRLQIELLFQQATFKAFNKKSERRQDIRMLDWRMNMVCPSKHLRIPSIVQMDHSDRVLRREATMESIIWILFFLVWDGLPSQMNQDSPQSPIVSMDLFLVNASPSIPPIYYPSWTRKAWSINMNPRQWQRKVGNEFEGLPEKDVTAFPVHILCSNNRDASEWY
mmetsp:Transcript_27954/g.82180  ORF Transcript_27954/g.82180 Transcript_27954/m.82180 type:complete len:196 (+) Transcript_27954:1372-1959(+)